MARSRTSAKAAGARFERVVADYLRDALECEYIDRKVKTGSRDTGDIGGVRAHGQRVVVETKDCATLSLPQWVREAQQEAVHDKALAGVVVAKRRGVSDPAQQWVVMTLADLAALNTGDRSHWMEEGK
jgi:hypothetical protein